MAIKFSKEQIIERFKSVHGDKFNYSKFEYSHKDKKEIIICETHGEFLQSRYHHESGSGCPECSGVPRGGFKRKTLAEFLENIPQAYRTLYDLSNFIYVNNATHGELSCKIHGKFEKTPKHIIRGQGCPFCSNKIKKNAEYLQIKVDDIHGVGMYDLSQFEYKDNKTKGTVICSIHGPWEIRPDNLIHSKNRCPSCAGIISKIETEIHDYVKTLTTDIITNSRDIINPLELDIYIPDSNLAIELNGIYFHTEISGNKSKYYHLNKTLRCLDKNISLFHIFEDEWNNKKNICKSMISNRLNKSSKKIYARNCVILPVSTYEASDFIENNHLQGYCKSSIKLGLYFNNELVSILTMGKSRYDKNIEWEITRFCTILDTNVIGGFNKLLTNFIKTYDPISIITYADRRYSEGNVYRNFGMIEQINNSINYFYVKSHSSQRLTRHQFQKHKLEKLLKIYDKSLSEWDNMKNNGYDRIWDCGNKKFIWLKD